MTPGKITEDNIERVLLTGSWIVLALLAVAGWTFRSAATGMGIMAGGLIALGNFYWLKSILRRALTLSPETVRRFALLRYILRLGIVGGILYLLIVRFGVDVFGLLIGISILVLNIFAITAYMLLHKGG